jgi:mono/diheme cytochrome c family protein
MTKKHRWIWAMPAFLVLAAFTHHTAGGWAVVTVQDLPDYAVAGEPLTLTYQVRQHGEDPIPNLQGTVTAVSAGRTLQVDARPAAQRGSYSATLTMPNEGDWSITINSGYARTKARLIPLRAVPRGTQAPALASDERGRRLFVAKGCITCHTHSDSKAEIGSGAIDLNGRTFAPQYLSEFLANPSIKPPATRGWQMPNLQLKQTEIAALVSFLNSSRRLAHGE